jgi:hypothetical protein
LISYLLALVGSPLAFVRGLFSLVGRPLPVVGGLLALIKDWLTAAQGSVSGTPLRLGRMASGHHTVKRTHPERLRSPSSWAR